MHRYIYFLTKLLPYYLQLQLCLVCDENKNIF